MFFLVQEKKNFREITEKYEKEFLSDLASLNCERPSIVLRVTRHVPDIVSFVQRLIDSNMAYATGSGSVYFDTQRFSVDSFFLPGETSQEFDSKGNCAFMHDIQHETQMLSPIGNGFSNNHS